MPVFPDPARWRSARAALLLMLAAAPGQAAITCAATSGAQTVPMVELFTSEGCDSCPPADRWLASQFPVARTAGDVTVLAFHVDYWDRLGWKDRFATAQYTQRQYAAMRANGATFVYTPQVLVQGHDAPSWRGAGRVSELLGATRKRPARARVTLAADGEPRRRPLGTRGGVGAGSGVAQERRPVDSLYGQRPRLRRQGRREPRRATASRSRRAIAARPLSDRCRWQPPRRTHARTSTRNPGSRPRWLRSCRTAGTATCCRRSRCPPAGSRDPGREF